VRRRDFITLVGGAAASWPVAARAQQRERMRRIGVLMPMSEDHSTGQRFLAAFRRGLQELGWAEGHTVQIEMRRASGDAERTRRYAEELVALAPDVILAGSTSSVTALRRTTRAVPIVFVGIVDAVGSGMVASLARPRGNATGFIVFEYAIAAKWLELLKEIAPGVTRAAVLRDSATPGGIGQFAAVQTVAPIGMELSVVGVRDSGDIEHEIAAFAREPNGGLIVTVNAFAVDHPNVVATLAAQHKLPAVYPFRYFINAGGLISYGPDEADQYRRAAGYVDRILKGEKPADLPVQVPTKYELVINLKTAKALGLDVPSSLLARADEVIE
jgi:putative tryptophan/tyrosine transport system substrate-binding protein